MHQLLADRDSWVDWRSLISPRRLYPALGSVVLFSVFSLVGPAARSLSSLATRLAAAQPAAPSTRAGEENLPQSDAVLDLTEAGEELGRLLPRLGKQYGVPLRTGRGLETQRVTLAGRGFRLPELARGLRELLSPSPEAGVLWVRRGAGWTLEESLNRRRLADALRAGRLEEYRRFLREQAVRSRRPQEPTWTPDALAVASLLDAGGEAGIERLLAGEPLVARIGDTPQPAREHLRRWLRQSLKASEPDKEGARVVLMRTGIPADPQGSALAVTVVSS